MAKPFLMVSGSLLETIGVWTRSHGSRRASFLCITRHPTIPGFVEERSETGCAERSLGLWGLRKFLTMLAARRLAGEVIHPGRWAVTIFSSWGLRTKTLAEGTL